MTNRTPDTTENRCRVLAIDDDADICSLIERTLLSCDLAGRATTSVEDFYGCYETLDPEIVVLDLQMAGADGIEILRWIAQHEHKAGVIIVSGADKRILSSARDFAQEIGLKVVGLLEKPFSIAAMRKSFQSLVSAAGEVGHADIVAALANDEFTLVYQPKVSTSDGEVLGVEALARWRHPSGEFLSPDRFLAMVEDSPLIDDFSDWVAREAVGAMVRWRSTGLELPVAINLSVRNLDNASWPERLSNLCRKAGVAESMLELEVTETATMGDAQRALEVLTRLRLKGFSLALDDFGTGHSSLTRLQRLPIASVKIDKSFVSNCIDDHDSAAIVRAVIGLAHALDLKVTAEGAENARTCELLRELGCDAVQGYHIARPMAADELESWLRERWLRRVV